MALFPKLFGRKTVAQPARQRQVVIRNYNAASKLARYADLGSSSGSADYELQNDLTMLRNRIRSLERNSGSMLRYLNLLSTNVIGETGLRLQVRVRRGDGNPDASLNAAVEKAFDLWSKKAAANGKMSLYALTKQAVLTWGRDGEVIWEIVRAGRFRDNIAINPIESDMLDETLTTIYPPTKNRIKMGVELDEYDAPVAYHFLTSHPGEASWVWQHTDNRHRRVPADRVLHLFEARRPGQTRGVPPASTTVHPIKMLDGYREAETVGRRLRSALMGFFQKQMPTSESLLPVADTVDEEEQILEMELEPGRLQQLPNGVEFKEFSPGGSQTDYAQFEQQVKKDQAQGFNISTLSHGMETAGVSFSTFRGVTIEDRDYYKMLQKFFIEGLMEPVFEMWATRHTLSDSSSIPATRLAIVVEMAMFRGRGWAWVDPTKDVKANSEALATGQTSLARVAADRGMDRDDLLDEIEEDRKAAEKRGLTLDYTGGKGSRNNNQPASEGKKQV